MHKSKDFPHDQPEAMVAYHQALDALDSLGIGRGYALEAVDNAIIHSSEYYERP